MQLYANEYVYMNVDIGRTEPFPLCYAVNTSCVTPGSIRRTGDNTTDPVRPSRPSVPKDTSPTLVPALNISVSPTSSPGLPPNSDPTRTSITSPAGLPASPVPGGLLVQIRVINMLMTIHAISNLYILLVALNLDDGFWKPKRILVSLYRYNDHRTTTR